MDLFFKVLNNPVVSEPKRFGARTSRNCPRSPASYKHQLIGILLAFQAVEITQNSKTRTTPEQHREEGIIEAISS